MPIGMPMGGWVDMPPMDVGVIGPMVVGVEGAVSEGELGGPIVDGEGTPEGDIIPTAHTTRAHRDQSTCVCLCVCVCVCACVRACVR
jgi:hypothetical protein